MYVKYFFKNKLRKYVIIRLHNLKLNTDIVQPGTYMSLTQSKKTAQNKTIKNFDVYYEKDNLCYLLILLNNI
jgi:hypothetical protein